MADTWLAAQERAQQAQRARQAYARAAQAAASAASAAQARVAHGTANQDMPPLDASQVLRAIESLGLPGARVSTLLIDLDEGLVRVEIELSELGQVAPCLESLSRATPGLIWQPTGVQASNGQRPDVITLQARAR